ncbi:MAG: glycosyltransferase [Defluviitaleaceae bacterium]|nr:glycosyltransferase [Defluviitaleaceae bacterium]
MNKISIIMPAYRAEATIRESIGSVIAQTYEDWELLVIDDASTDKTLEIANAFAEFDDRIRVFAGKVNKGVASARNAGIRQATGEYLAFLDSDDLWHESKLEKQLRFMLETGAEISFTATSYINAAGRPYAYVLPAEDKFSYRALRRRNIMSCSSVMVRRDCMIPFPPGFMHEDYAVWLQIVKKAGQARGLNEPLLMYRMSENSKSAGRLASAKMTFSAYRTAGYGRIRSAFFTLRYALHSISKRRKIRAKRAMNAGEKN